MIGHTHHTAIKQHSSTIAEFDIHRKPKIRKSVFLHGQEISYFSAAVSGSISYFLMFLGVRDARRDEKNCDYSKIGRKECDYFGKTECWKSGSKFS